MAADTPAPCWQPSAQAVEAAAITRFARERDLPEAYADLHRWSVEHLDEFWGAVWDHFGVGRRDGPVLGSRAMPGAEWFPGTEVNYAARLFAGKADDRIALRHASETRALGDWTWGELRVAAARFRAGLLAAGVERGDRVAALMPNIPETVAAFLATASLGAVWSSAAPEFGARAVIDRVAQIDPKVLLAVDGYRYGGTDFRCDEKVAAISAALPDARVVRFGYLDESGWEDGFLGPADAELAFEPVPFAHPLWVLYSSGTTGLPKGIVHGHGGILLEQLKTGFLQLDCRADDCFFWFTTTGWMMWNFVVGILLTDACVVLYDGSPAGEVLWDLASDAGVTMFGTSPAFVSAAMTTGADPGRGRDLSRIRAVSASGAPLGPEGFAWIYDNLGEDVWLFTMSGGTDVCAAFVGPVPTLPVHLGEMQAPALGVKVEAFDDDGRSVVGEVGELVITEPMPSMPVGLWNDPDGERYRETYFDTYPGVWRHGDWIRIGEGGTSVIYGRSDATINRGGVRMGTSEIYRAVLADPDVVDALAVDVPRDGAESWLPLFVVLRDGASLDDEVVARIKQRVRRDCSPRHVPDTIHAVVAVPRTLSGKVLEIPVKRILMGGDPDRAASRDSLSNPDSLDAFVSFRAAAPAARAAPRALGRTR